MQRIRYQRDPLYGDGEFIAIECHEDLYPALAQVLIEIGSGIEDNKYNETMILPAALIEGLLQKLSMEIEGEPVVISSVEAATTQPS